MSTGTAPVSTPETAPLSQGARVVNTFVAPSKTFLDIRRSASWWLPLLLVMIVTGAFMKLAYTKLDPVQLAENSMRAMPKLAKMMEQLPPEARQQQLESMRNKGKTTPFTAPIAPVVVVLIVAAVLLGTFNFGLGGELSYKTCLAVVCYSQLVGILKFVLAAIVLLAGVNPEGYDINNPLATNLGAFVDPANHVFLYWFGMFIDVFAIWTLVLAGIGFSIVAPKVKRSTAMAVVFGWYLVFALLFAGAIAMFLG